MSKLVNIVLVYATLGSPAPSVPPGSRAVMRREDLWDGHVETTVGKVPVVAVHAPGRPELVAAYQARGIPALKVEADQAAQSTEVVEAAAPLAPAPAANAKNTKKA